jgi:glyoxylase-like metal-dependent hydrolase (beta-lactamase superfamily II)
MDRTSPSPGTSGMTAVPTVTEAPSTVAAAYVEPSIARALQPGEKLDRLYQRNVTQPYVLQRLAERTYWIQRRHYATIFYVGDKGVLLFDPLDTAGETIRQAIGSVTRLPVTALVYSHAHADHIGDAPGFAEAAARAGVRLRVIASQATAEKLAFLGSKLPKPSEIVSWPHGSFRFEGMGVQFHGFERGAHTDDHGVWLLVGERVAHVPDLVNPDQPPFWAFAGSENFVYYEDNLEALARLDWTHLSGGHGNVGAKADLQFYRTFLADLKQAVGQAMRETPWGTGVDAARVNAHTPFLPAWFGAVARKATEALRHKYGSYYGYEAATPRNAEMVAEALFSYR